MLDGVVLGFGRLRGERRRRVSQGARGGGVGGEAEGRDGGGRHVGASAGSLRRHAGSRAGGLRVQRREVGGQTVFGQSGGEAVRGLQGGADGQVLLIGHDSQSISHQAVCHASVRLLSDSAAEEHAA